jgi:molybdopterin/thiamine biosynthesis adenylyltransferase
VIFLDENFYSILRVWKQVAAKTASSFNPSVRITPIHDNIKEPQYDIPWVQQFDIVLNALDNLGLLSTTHTS